MKRLSRRQFVKKSILWSAGATTFPMIFVPKSQAAWNPGTPLHPNIDNLRVVSVTDPRMIRGVAHRVGWASQEKMVVTDTVWENMDNLACKLADTRSSEDAWRAIFVKPPRKSWSDTVVAIKTNNINRQHTHSAVMSRVCHALTDTIGVKPSNIHIYDACHGDGMRRSTPFKGLPSECRIEETWGGSDTASRVSGIIEKRTRCLKPLAKGEVDILVNVSMCKGHSSRFGGFTMTMKNHFGTFAPEPGHSSTGLEYLIGINQTHEILGPMDKKTGKVLYPRQQLCIVDALWSSRGGPGGNPTNQSDFLSMGVTSPVLDYQIATRFRAERMGWKPNMNATRKMLEAFGYSESALPDGGKLIEV